MGELVIWMGGLPRGVTSDDIEKFLKGYGKISDVQVRSSPRDVFAFVTFGDRRDAEEAVQQLNQREFLRSEHTVQMARANRNNTTSRRSRSPRRSRSRQPPRRSRSRSPPRRSDSRGRREERTGFVVWIGGLPRGVEEEEIKKFFKGYGEITYIRIRSSPKDIFAFVTFTDPNDGRDAVKELDQTRFPGTDNVIQIRESATARPDRDVERHGSRDRGRSRGGGRDDDYPRRASPARRSGAKYRIKLSYLPRDMTWGELKDIARTFGESIKYTNVFVEREVTCGIIEYVNREDAEYALKQMDRRRMDGHGERIKAKKEDDWD